MFFVGILEYSPTELDNPTPKLSSVLETGNRTLKYASTENILDHQLPTYEQKEDESIQQEYVLVHNPTCLFE